MPSPIFYFDDTCNLCRYWVDRWRKQTGDRVCYVAFDHPQEKISVEYHHETGNVSRGAEAVACLYANVPGKGWLLFLYQRVKPLAWLGEIAYRLVASCRSCKKQARPFIVILIGIFVFTFFLLTFLR